MYIYIYKMGLDVGGLVSRTAAVRRRSPIPTSGLIDSTFSSAAARPASSSAV